MLLQVPSMFQSVSNLSLRAKLVAVFSSLTLVLTGILLVELPRAMDRQSLGWVESRALGLGQLLGRAVEASIDFEDAAAAQQALAGIRSTRGAAYARLIHQDGTALAEWVPSGVQVVPPPGTGQAAAVVGGLLRVRVPVTTRAGRSATLLLGFDLDEMEERRREARASVLWTALLLLAVGFGAAVVMGTLLARPILCIRDVARRVAGGDALAAGELPLGRRDEVGQLATVLAHMLEQLYGQQRQIKAINADLAEQVEARTLELARTNEAKAQLEETQEQLVMADRRISVGRLAAGVAHEINNPLAFLSGNLDFVASEIPEIRRWLAAGSTCDLAAAGGRLEELAAAVADSRQGARRVLRIVRGLKTFARDDDDQRELLRLEGPVEAAIEMANHEIKHRARLVRRFGPAPLVLASEVRLSQVILNLLINAAQAIPEGASDQNEIVVALSTDPAGRAVLAVRDSGAGMTPEVMNRIFDPFFTTKPVGVGSGLGLPISRNIVAKFGGEITVESAPGQGSTFRVTLPAGQRADPAAVGPSSVVLAVPSGPASAATKSGLRLLVVDDEPLVGQMVARALRRDAEVVPATSARQALALIRGGRSFDRILCDLMMPEMGGPELHAELARLAPQYLPRLIFMTGGAFTEGARAFTETWEGPLLEKPLDHDELRRLLHEPPV
jgi:signal transduction histidine kinase/CheY-like chemotaxis protein